MRVAAIYDIHGNLPALEAVLEDIRQAEVELVVVGGMSQIKASRCCPTLIARFICFLLKQTSSRSRSIKTSHDVGAKGLRLSSHRCLINRQ